MISVLIANTKGGCGKTTIATHVAAAFAAEGRSTALADADRQRSSLSWAGLRPGTAAPKPGLMGMQDCTTQISSGTFQYIASIENRRG